MNLYPSRDDDPEAPLAPPEWTMTVGREGAGETIYHFAWIYRHGSEVCKLSLATRTTSDEMAERALATKARYWIDDYLRRSHEGTTDFGGPT